MRQQHVVAVNAMFALLLLLLLLLLFQLSVIIHSTATFESIRKKFDSLHANSAAVAAAELWLQLATGDRMCLSQGNPPTTNHQPPTTAPQARQSKSTQLTVDIDTSLEPFSFPHLQPAAAQI